MRKKWTLSEINLLKNTGYTHSYLSRILNRTKKSIKIKCSRLKIKRDNPYKSRTKYPYNGFFKTWSHKMAYVLGVWWADGNIFYKPSKYCFSITSKDIDWLLNIKKLIGTRSPFRYNKDKQTFTLVISQKEIVEDIINLGGVPNKSLIAKPPKNISEEFVGSFIAGYIHGDGWIFASKKYNYPRIGFIGTKEISLWFHSFLGVPNSFKLTHPERNTNTWTSNYHGQKAQMIIKKLFLNHPKSYFLQRKIICGQKSLQWKPTKKYWTSNEISKLYNLNLSLGNLAKQLKRSKSSIQNKCNELNIIRRKFKNLGDK